MPYGYGGAAFHNAGLLTITNCTLSGNYAAGGNGKGGGAAGINGVPGTPGSTGVGGIAQGGAVYHTGAGKTSLTNDTIVRNYISKSLGGSSGSGGGIFAAFTTIELLNKLLALNHYDVGIIEPPVSLVERAGLASTTRHCLQIMGRSSSARRCLGTSPFVVRL